MSTDRQRAGVTIELGRRVRTLRTAKGLSQEKLAEKAKVHRTYVGSLERGERNVALINIVRLADALEVDPSELVLGMTSDD
jgi:transcriptional regulator with XRE-family HTH domain